MPDQRNAASLYRALGDPIRLEMVARLSARSTCTLGELSKDLGVSRQGARKQLQVLVDAEVVILKQCGRRTDAALNRHSLEDARDFIAQLEQQWDTRLEALKNFVEEQE